MATTDRGRGQPVGARRDRGRHAGRPVPQPGPRGGAAGGGRPASTCCVAGQLVVLRSTVFPGVTRRVEQLLAPGHPDVDLAFCPERIAEGRAMTELFTLPQLVAARTRPGPATGRRAVRQADRHRSIELEPEEAELAKLFTNSWRYIKFAAANQYYMIANDLGSRLRPDPGRDDPRLPARRPTCPGAGFAAGPCLFKDTMQLASVTGGSFALGHSAMLVNEGLPDYLVRRIEQEHDLPAMTVGILGMAFKAESDDRRSSLSYRLKRVLGVPGRAGADDRPVRRRRPRPGAARAGAGRGRPARRRRAARGLSRPGRRHPRRRRVEPARRGVGAVTRPPPCRWSSPPTTRPRASPGCSTG